MAFIPRIKEIDLTTERLDPGEPLDIIGYAITAITDGSLDGIKVRIDRSAGDLISFAAVNPYPYPPGFTKLYLQNTAQAGKYLWLYISGPDAIVPIEMAYRTRNTSIVSQTVGVSLQPDWAARVAEDKDFQAYDGSVGIGGFVGVNYAVTSGITLYMCAMSFTASGYAIADRNLNQMGVAKLTNITDAVVLARRGGNGGASIVFPKPLAIAGGKTMGLLAENFANHTMIMGITGWGYERED